MDKILILGGTGAMGSSLVKHLSERKFKVSVTSRAVHTSNNPNISYIQGNAKDKDWLMHLLSEHWDVIVDFMSYTTSEFKERYQMLLNSTSQYIFISSARVYAKSDVPLTEDSPRLLDVCTDTSYLATDEYALSKARQENILKSLGKANYTIVRPSLTYNTHRYQLAVFEKEDWLCRVLNNKKIVFPDSLASIEQTLTYGEDVALAISKLIANPKALGETVHIAGADPVTWNEALSIYTNYIEQKTGKKIKVHHIPNADKLCEEFRASYQLKYARGISRTFDNSKLKSIIGEIQFTDFKTGIEKCLNDFLGNENINQQIKEQRKNAYWAKEAYLDKLSHDFALIGYFKSIKHKIGYLIKRFYK